MKEGKSIIHKRHQDDFPAYDISYRKINDKELEWNPEVNQSFSLFLVSKGLGQCTMDGQKKDVHDQDLYFMFPGQECHWRCREVEMEQICISETIFETFGSYLKYPFSHYMKIGKISLAEEDFEKFKYEFSNIEKECSDEKNGQLMAEFRLKVILLMLSREVYRMHYEKRMDSACLLSRFITLVFENFRDHRMVRFYADKLSVTNNYLNVLCMKHLGKTATGIINGELLTEVKQYLMVSNMPIKELSILMNFSSINSFYAFFKRYTGMTPKEFQNRYKGIPTLHMVPEDL